MKKLLFTIMVLAAMTACSEMREDITGYQKPATQTVNGVVMQVADIPYAEGATRSSMAVDASGLSFTWSDGDKTGVYSSTDGFALFNLTSGAGTSSATFDGGGFTLTDGATYYSFFPYAAAATDKTAVPVDFTGQTLTQDDDMVSPMAKDYLYASAVADEGNALFNYSHIGSFVRTKLTMPASTSVESVDFIPMYAELTQQGTVDVTAAGNPLTATVISPKMTLALSGVDVPSSGELTLWGAMAPQDLSATTEAVAIVAHSGANIYSARVAGKNLQAGKAYRWTATPIDIKSDPDYGFSTVTEVGLKDVTSTVGSGEYSGITYLGETQYAVVDDKKNGGGIVLYNIVINDDGTVGDVSMTIPSGTSGSVVTDRDNEGIAYVPGSPGTLFVSAEAEQSIKEYDLYGNLTGRALTIPADMAIDKITSNKGFEALTYNFTTELFWTTTESELTKDNAMKGLLRLQSFGTDLKPAQRYLYQMDSPVKTSEEAAAAASYVYAVPALAALDDGRIIVLEREVFVANGTVFEKAMNSFTKINLYVVNPSTDTSGILRKTLFKSFTTQPLESNFANYEGMCLGPTLTDGSKTLVMIPDSQNGSGGLTKEYVKVITFK